MLDGKAGAEAAAAYEEWLEQWSGIEDITVLGFDDDLFDDELLDEDFDDEEE